MHDDHELGRREPPVAVELKDSARPAQEHQAEQDARREIPSGGWSTMEIEPRCVWNWHLPPDHPHAVICEASTIEAAETIAQALNGRAERDRFEKALGRACLVGGTAYLTERAEKAEAERDTARAEVERLKQESAAPVAAAYEVAANEAKALGDGHDGEEMAEAILALTPADATAALQAERDRAFNEGIEAAAAKIGSFGYPGFVLRDAILALRREVK